MNFKKLISYFIFGISLIPFPAVCQYGFKKVIDYNDSRSLNFDDIQVRNDKIYISGNAYIDSVNLWGQSFAEFDTNGISLWQKTYLDSTSHIIKNTPARFYFCENGNIIIPIKYFNRGNLGLIFLDSIGNEVGRTEF